jgi:ParB family transcriptional regulator, chromosome partitioning protein
MEPIDAAHSELQEIPVQSIDRNPENPRIVFRPTELEDLLESIRRYGVQVPVSVYKEGSRHVLIDGERRWRCSLKLNKPTIPALVQKKPDPLTNLLLMFNIHALREQWDLLTIALKLPRIIQLLTERLGRAPNERELAGETGQPRAVIRRSKLLMELPDHYKHQILMELNKPKRQQRLTEDFFIEMERSLKTVDRAMPGIIEHKDKVRDVLIGKYTAGIISNITHFRNLSKIARAERVEADRAAARSALKRVFERNKYSIQSAYEDSVSGAYSARDIASRVGALIEQLRAMPSRDLEPEIRKPLERLYALLSKVLGH